MVSVTKIVYLVCVVFAGNLVWAENAIPPAACWALLQSNEAFQVTGSRVVYGYEDEPDVRVTIARVPFELEGRKPLKTEVFLAMPDNVTPDTPIVVLSPGLSKSYKDGFDDLAIMLARQGVIAYSYDHTNVGVLKQDYYEEVTPQEDVLLAKTVYDSLPMIAKADRKLLSVGHSRGELVAPGFAKLLREDGVSVVGLLGLMPYIRWASDSAVLEELRKAQVLVEAQNSIAESFENLFQSLAPPVFWMTNSFFAKRARRRARQTLENLSEAYYEQVAAIILRIINEAQAAVDISTALTGLPDFYEVLLADLLKSDDPLTIRATAEKIRGMQPKRNRNAHYLGDHLIGLEDVPVMVVSAESQKLDPLSTPEMAEELKRFAKERGWENLSFLTVPGVDHYFPETHPEESLQIILEFLRLVTEEKKDKS